MYDVYSCFTECCFDFGNAFLMIVCRTFLCSINFYELIHLWSYPSRVLMHRRKHGGSTCSVGLLPPLCEWLVIVDIALTFSWKKGVWQIQANLVIIGLLIKDAGCKETLNWGYYLNCELSLSNVIAEFVCRLQLRDQECTLN